MAYHPSKTTTFHIRALEVETVPESAAAAKRLVDLLEPARVEGGFDLGNLSESALIDLIRHARALAAAASILRRAAETALTEHLA